MYFDTSSHCAAHFRAKRLAAPPPFPWDQPYRLTPGERTAIASSIAQFQLGESSEGHHLIARAQQWAAASGDPSLVEALREFITEEQRHSRWLGVVMGQNAIPKLKSHWVDDAFRGLRKLLNLEVAVTVLVTAEVIAVPYYTALRDATRCPLLRAICTRILEDEHEHLAFQGRTLGLLRGNAIGLRWTAHRAGLEAAFLLVWAGHGPVFRRAGMSWNIFRAQCLDAFEELRQAAAREITQVPVLSSM